MIILLIIVFFLFVPTIEAQTLPRPYSNVYNWPIFSDFGQRQRGGYDWHWGVDYNGSMWEPIITVEGDVLDMDNKGGQIISLSKIDYRHGGQDHWIWRIVVQGGKINSNYTRYWHYLHIFEDRQYPPSLSPVGSYPSYPNGQYELKNVTLVDPYDNTERTATAIIFWIDRSNNIAEKIFTTYDNELNYVKVNNVYVNASNNEHLLCSGVVNQGEIIAPMGNSGMAYPPSTENDHLHLSLTSYNIFIPNSGFDTKKYDINPLYYVSHDVPDYTLDFLETYNGKIFKHISGKDSTQQTEERVRVLAYSDIGKDLDKGTLYLFKEGETQTFDEAHVLKRISYGGLPPEDANKNKFEYAEPYPSYITDDVGVDRGNGSYNKSGISPATTTTCGEDTLYFIGFNTRQKIGSNNYNDNAADNTQAKYKDGNYNLVCRATSVTHNPDETQFNYRDISRSVIFDNFYPEVKSYSNAKNVVDLVFSENVDKITAENKANYSIDEQFYAYSVAIQSASVLPNYPYIVRLNTSDMTEDNYWLNINNVTDVANNQITDRFLFAGSSFEAGIQYKRSIKPSGKEKSVPDTNLIADPGDNLNFVLGVTNKAGQKLTSVWGSLVSLVGNTNYGPKYFGDINVDQTNYNVVGSLPAPFNVTIPDNATNEIGFELQLSGNYESGGIYKDTIKIFLPVGRKIIDFAQVDKWLSISDGPIPGQTGSLLNNGNHKIDPDEEIDLNFALQNTTSNIARSVWATIYVDSAYLNNPDYITVIQPVVHYGNIQPGQALRSLSNFVIRTGAFLPRDPTIPFIIGIHSNINGKDYYEERRYIIKPPPPPLPVVSILLGKFSPNGDGYKDLMPISLTYIGAQTEEYYGYINTEDAENLRVTEPDGYNGGSEYYFHFAGEKDGQHYKIGDKDTVYISGSAPREVDFWYDKDATDIPDGTWVFNLIEWACWKTVKEVWLPDWCKYGDWDSYEDKTVSVVIDRVYPVISNYTIDKTIISSKDSTKVDFYVSEIVEVSTNLIDPTTNNPIYSPRIGWRYGGPVSFYWNIKGANPPIPSGYYQLQVGVNDSANPTVTSAVDIRIDNTPPRISDLATNPVFISPNDDGNNDMAEITCTLYDEFNDPILVRTSIFDSLGNILPTYPLYVPNQTSGSFGFAWDGKYSGNPMPEGRYMAVIEAEDPVGNVSADTIGVVLDLTSPQCSQSAIGNPAFSPNGDDCRDQAIIVSNVTDNSFIFCGSDTLLHKSNGFRDISANIFDTEGNYVASLEPNQYLPYLRDPLPYQHTWGGTGESGDLMPEGRYQFQMTISDMAANSVGWGSQLVLDVTAPSLSLYDITPRDNDPGNSIPVIPNNGSRASITLEQSLEFSYDLLDNLAGADSVAITLNNGQQSTTVRKLWPQGLGGSFVWDGKDNAGVDILEGIYSFTIASQDLAGNSGNTVSAAQSGISEIFIDRTGPFVSAEAVPYVISDGGATTLTYRVKEGMSDPVLVNITVHSETDPSIAYPQLVTDQIVVTNNALQEYRVIWDGAGLSMPDGRFVFTIEAKDELGNTTVAYAHVVKNRMAPQISSPTGPVPANTDVCIRGVAVDPDWTNQHGFADYRTYVRQGENQGPGVNPDGSLNYSGWMPIPVPAVNQDPNDPLFPNSNVSIRPQSVDGVLASWLTPDIQDIGQYTISVAAREKVTNYELHVEKTVTVDPRLVYHAPVVSVIQERTDGLSWMGQVLNPEQADYDTLVLNCSLSGCDALIRTSIFEGIPENGGYRKGRCVEILPATQVLAGQSVKQVWDGREYRDAFVNDGQYILLTEAFALDGIGYGLTQTMVGVDTRLSISGLQVTPASFDPMNLGGVHQATVAYGLNKDADVLIEICSQTDYSVVKRLIQEHQYGSGQGVRSATWDGSNDAGSNVPTGDYYFRVTCTAINEVQAESSSISVITDELASDLIVSLNDMNITDGVADYTYRAFGQGLRKEYNPRPFQYHVSAEGRQRVKEYRQVPFSIGFKKWHDEIKFWVAYACSAHLRINAGSDKGWYGIPDHSPVLRYYRGLNGANLRWRREPS